MFLDCGFYFGNLYDLNAELSGVKLAEM